MSRFLFRRALRTRPRLPRRRQLRIDSLEDRTVPSLTLTLADPAILEGTKTVGTLTRTGDLSQPLTVTLDSSDHSEVNIPGSITILAGKSSISFGVFGIDDTEADGAQDVNLLAWVDGEPGTAYATVKVYDNDSTPIVQPDSYDGGEDQPLTVYGYGVTANDYSGNGDMTASLVTGPSHGTVVLEPMGGFTYTPFPNYNGPDSFIYKATDPAGFSGQAKVSITVWEMNDPLELHVPGPQTTAEEVPITFSAANGNAITITDVDSPRLMVSLLASGGSGILTLKSTAGLEFPYPDSVNNSFSITFYADSPAEANAALEGLVLTPNANYNGTFPLDVQIQDTTYPSFPTYVSASVPVTVTPVNDVPVAVDDFGETWEDSTTLSGPAVYGVLANDSDVDELPGSNTLTAVLVSGPSHGTVTLNPNGTFTYLSDLNYNGTDSFTYRASDGVSLSNVATVTLTVHPMDDWTQVVVPGAQTTAEDTALVFSPANGNAITVVDPESPQVLVALLVQDGILTLPSTAGLEFPYPDSVNNSPSITFIADNPAEANAELAGLIFTPNPDFNGVRQLSILVRDLDDVYVPDVWADVQISVTPVNDPPVAADNIYEAIEDQNLSVIGLGVLGNDSDSENDPLTAVLVSGPSHGTLTLNPGGSFTYTPAPNYFGQDSFTYRAADATSQSNVATVTIVVAGKDDPIDVTAPATRTTPEDTPVVFSAATGTAITVTDPESPRVYVEMGTYGIITLKDTTGLEFPYPEYTNNAAKIYFYADSPAEVNAALEGLTVTPYPDYSGKVTLTVFVRDESITTYSVSDWSETSITVTAVNDAPVAVADGPYTIEAGEPLITTTGGGGAAIGVLANDTDVDGDSLSAVLVDGPSHGTLTFNSDGSFTYTAEATYSGTDAFTYRASDGQLQSDPATVTIQVTPRNLPPVTVADAYSVDEDGKLAVAAPGVLGNDADPEGQPLTAQLWSGASHGTVTFNPDGSFTYLPAANCNGADEFWYRSFDGQRYSAPTRVGLTVNPVNDTPVAVADSYALDEDTPLTVAAPGVLANDTDIDGDALSATVVTGPAHGTVTVNADGSFTYTPAANYVGADSFTYRASDPAGAGSTATVSLTVRPVNDAPVAVNDSYTGTEEAAISAVVPGTTSVTMTSDPGDYIGQGQTYNLTPQNGTLTISRNYDNGVSVSWTSTNQMQWWDWDFAAPDEGLLVPGMYSNAMRFPFQTVGRPGMDVSGNGRGSNTLTGWFRIDEIAYGTNGEVLVFNATFEQHSEGATPALRGTVRYNAGGTAPGGVLLNDTDAEGSPLTATLVEGPQHGQLVFNPNGTFMYVPEANFAGTDTFQYRVSDGTLTSNVATVTLNVSAVNDAPVNVVPGTQTLVEDTTLTFSTANGNAIRLTDVDAGSSLIELRLSVNGFLTFPTTAGLTFVTGSNGGNLIVVRGTLADLNAALDGLVFRPGANFNGTFSLQVITNDLGNTGSGGAKSDLDYIDLHITPVNDPPQNVVPLITPVTPEDTALTFSPAIWVSDVDASTGSGVTPVKVTLEFAAGGGTLSVTPGGGVTITGNGTGQVMLTGPLTYVNNVLRTLKFTPIANANDVTAPVQIRMTTDDQANGGPGALTDTDVFAVSVTPVNDAPTTTGLSPVSVDEDAAPTAVTLTGSFADIEDGGSGLTYSVVDNTNPGLFSSVAVVDGVLTLAYAANANGTGTLTVRATDSGGLWVETPLAVAVSAVNDAPTTGGLPAVSVPEDSAPTAVTLTDHFADIEDGASGLTFSVTGNTNPDLFGSVSVSGGVLTIAYTPDANGSAAVTVRATDTEGLWVEALLAVSVTPINDAPTTTGLPPVSVNEDAAPTAVTLAGSFADIEDGAAGLAYSVVGNTNPDMFGSVSVSGGVLTVSYAPDANGTATLTVRATDSGGLWVETPLAVTVTPVNDAPAFTAGPNVTVASDAGPQSFSDWASGISAGSANEAGQSLTFDVSTDSPLLFAVQPFIDPATGALNFTPVLGASGTATVTVVLHDDGGTADGGADASAPVTFTITLNPPAGTPGVQVVGTTLVVTGGTGTDSVTIAVAGGGNGSNGLKVTGTVNGQNVNKTFKQAFTGIRVNTDGGNDTVSIADGVGLPTTVDGGAGADSLKGGGGNDLIFGGLGNDTINGAAGDDNIDAGAGNDSVTAGQGRDLVFGQAGDDTLLGGDGNDFLIGGLGADQLFGQNGDDIVVAGSAAVRSPSSDSLRQVLTDWGPAVPGIYASLRARLAVTDDPASADRLEGDAQTDWFWSADPADVLDIVAGEQRN
ncbi:MAG TPA: Ig-like domain-containing protein [Gemmataceae bacterium]|nr:Ig-like domain-containing protein [Gemmataceae bacterium]